MGTTAEMEMSEARRMELFYEARVDPAIRLTSEEVKAGYHFCPDWDYLVVGPEDPEKEGCSCDS